MKEYQKIETVYERDMNGSKKLTEGVFRNPLVGYLAENKWSFTEKIDGTNIRVHWDGHKVEFAGRTDKAQIPPHLHKKLEAMFGGEDNEQVFEQMFGEKEVILCGEGYGKKIQNGGNYIRDDVDFILFDVMVGDYYLNDDAVTEIATALGIHRVPFIMSGTIAEAVEYVKLKPDSTIGIAKMEGLVGKPVQEVYDKRGNRVIVKIKCRDF